MMINTAFYPTLMWNSRFNAPSGDPFDNSKGFVFPDPEGGSLSFLPHLLTAQAFIPPTERTEAAGFHFPGGNDDIRAEVLRRLNADTNYRRPCAGPFAHVKEGAPIKYEDFARAIAEFEFTQVYADAPLDRYAWSPERVGTVGEARWYCSSEGWCVHHAVSGCRTMFRISVARGGHSSDRAPSVGNVTFDGPGRTRISDSSRSPGIRRTATDFDVAAAQPGAGRRSCITGVRQPEDAMRYHLNAQRSETYTTAKLRRI